MTVERQISETGQGPGPADDAQNDVEMGYPDGAMQHYSSNGWEADSDAPEAAPADDQIPGTVQSPPQPFSFRPDAPSSSPSTANAGPRDISPSSHSSRPTSAIGRPTGHPASAAIFDLSDYPPRQSAPNPERPSSGPGIAGEGNTSIAAFRPDSGAAAKAADANAMQMLPTGVKQGLTRGRSAFNQEAEASQAQQDFESAAMLFGLPPRPVQVNAYCMFW